MSEPVKPTGPVLIELDDVASETPASAPPVPDLNHDGQPAPQAMEMAVKLATRSPSKLARWFWSLLVTLIGFMVSLAAWDYVNALLARSPVLGLIVTALLVAVALVLVVFALREMAAFARLRRVDQLQTLADASARDGDLTKAREVTTALARLYGGREDMRWALARFEERAPDVLDADGVLALASLHVLTPLDEAAKREVEAAARQVATVTAIVPLALADVAVALSANIRMIRRVAEIYGGRSGALGSWRLTRSVMAHVVATGAVAMGDDLLGSVAGGSVLSKVSRRFGEGLVNGALTARVGVAAMDVCRPIAFSKAQRPSVTGLVKRALTGLFAAS
ncbi:MAG: YcjF family protein [Maritimibacter sp.]